MRWLTDPPAEVLSELQLDLSVAAGLAANMILGATRVAVATVPPYALTHPNPARQLGLEPTGVVAGGAEAELTGPGRALASSGGLANGTEAHVVGRISEAEAACPAHYPAAHAGVRLQTARGHLGHLPSPPLAHMMVYNSGATGGMGGGDVARVVRLETPLPSPSISPHPQVTPVLHLPPISPHLQVPADALLPRW